MFEISSVSKVSHLGAQALIFLWLQRKVQNERDLKNVNVLGFTKLVLTMIIRTMITQIYAQHDKIVNFFD